MEQQQEPEFSLNRYRNIMDTVTKESQWSEKNETDLLEPYNYIASQAGKEIRSKMIAAFNTWLKVPQETLTAISKVVSMLHTASLLADDIEDDSQLRRGIPVAHKVYGVPQTINCSNYALFSAYRELFNLQDSVETQLAAGPNQPPQKIDLLRIVNDEILNLHRGQGLDLLWRDTLTCPTEAEYLDMVKNKTGGLFRLSIKLMMTCASEHRDIDYLPLVNLFGVYFQIRDDYANLHLTEYEDNKGFAEDLTEGKFSFPIVHSIRTNPSNRQLLNILQKRPTEATLKRHAINYMENTTKSFDYTISVLRILQRQTEEEIARLGGNAALETILNSLKV